MRWSIVARPSAPLRGSARSPPASRAASNRRGSTTVHPSAVAMHRLAEPVRGNSGAGSRQIEPASIGTRPQEPCERLEVLGAAHLRAFRRSGRPGGEDHGPALLGRGIERRRSLRCAAGRGSGSRSPVVPGVARIRTTGPSVASVTTSVNSPSWTSTLGCSRRSTAPSSGADIDVLSSSESAPSFDAATIVSTKPASLRHRIPSRSPGPSPDAFSPRAIAFVRASTSA